MKPAADYFEKNPEYFSCNRHDVLGIIPAAPIGRVLEIGAADGSTLVALKKSGRAREVVGVEFFPVPGDAQSRPEIDRFIYADIEQQSIDLGKDAFDLLICADVLEHLRDPWGALKYLYDFLRVGGHAVISLPNILYWRAFGRILSGDFRYSASGVLDKTHLRFFCKKNILDLVRSTGLEIISVEPTFKRHVLLKQDRLLNTLSLGLAERMLAQQYLVLAIKKHPSDPSGQPRP